MKTCRTCGETKELPAFPTNRDGNCRKCKNEVEKERYHRNKERLLAQKKQYYIANKEHRVVVDKARRVRNRFGITVEEYEALRTDNCPICDAKNPNHLDHNHDTGQLREFLCGTCNRGIGLLKDDPELLRRAAEYLERHLIKE